MKRRLAVILTALIIMTGTCLADSYGISDRTAQELAQLKSALSVVVEETPNQSYSSVDPNGPSFTKLSAYIRTPAQTFPGQLTESKNHCVCYLRVDHDCYVYATTTAPYGFVRVSDEAPVVGTGNDYTGSLYEISSINSPTDAVKVLAGQYVAVNDAKNSSSSFSTLYFSDGTYALVATIPLSSKMEEEINDGWFVDQTLDRIAKWENGGWKTTSNSVNASITYEAYCPEDIVFDYDAVIITQGQYYIRAWLGDTHHDKTMALVVPKDTAAHITISRFDADSSEVIDPVEFAQHATIINAHQTDEYNLLKASFYGLGMFRRIGICGDSYSAVRLGHSWGQVVAGELGIEVLNFSKGGTDSNAWVNDAVHGLPLLLTSDKCDLYWLALGINDASTVRSDPAYLGSPADLEGGDYTQYPNTFWGNQGRIIESIRAYAPYAKIVMFKPIYANMRTVYGVRRTTNLPLIRTAIEQIAERYGIPVMDCADDIFYHSPEYADHMDYDISNGNHPSVVLYPGIAHANMRLFSKCVAENPTYFMDTDYSAYMRYISVKRKKKTR